MNPVIRCLAESRNILLTTHINPDGDAVGSLLALGLGLEKWGKSVVMLNTSPIPAVYRFLPSAERIAQRVPNGIDFDAAVILDCGNLKRIGEVCRIVNRIGLVLNIDHHVTNDGFGDIQLVNPQACATAEIVYDLIKKLNISIDRDMANAIYTGILTDTGSFRFSNTNAEAFAICQEMATLGVDPYKVAQHVYGTYSLGRIKLLNLALDSIEISLNGKLSIMTVTQEMLNQTGTQPEDADGLIHYARRIEDVKVAALIQELKNGLKEDKNSIKNQFHVSLRSDGSVDVGSIAAAYGGGGHQSAAGFGMQAPLSDIKSEITTIADKL
jgi:phosphoesterase RecJ-like protein